MSETLKGNLSQLKLVEIMKILCNSQRTGKLSLQRGEDTGDVYFLSGEVIHAKYNTVMGENAVYALLSWTDGIFTFLPNISVKNKTILTGAQDIIRRGEQIDADWQEIRKVIPHTNLVFKMSYGTPSEISLNATEWNILRHINGIDSVSEIAGKVELPILDVSKAFCKLFNAGLIEMMGEAVTREERKVGIDPGIFQLIEREMAKVIGPLAPIVMDDHIGNLGESREAFPKDKLPELIELLSGEINDPKKMIDFQRNMLEMIKNV
ncbi:MAG TPA: DUF4388 domain-containing protein [Acidobacteriota bacterium]|jgi:hypothetical protein|nr:DUF4388 domain-containing protein [Acidobacteriota bacterium]HNR38303.1 DUF4388 domain-containing protein [Acidobacteriota bacterium]HNU00852.1 DUF4388 domain-containing protein [Acidobacteriota bacterium]HPB27572.1 DUF4388 domain-containing protein [Acidobacteriota bacterium]HQO24586.1 DUF4388 domain-containing protein [Acidobacteriota bacterium]